MNAGGSVVKNGRTYWQEIAKEKILQKLIAVVSHYTHIIITDKLSHRMNYYNINF